ncbi:MAG TPA: hypothetical protein VFX70_11530, partial [Mycobacteriales bacterium]|nr:hypothetical protein [Mycobacteriales bacterium]
TRRHEQLLGFRPLTDLDALVRRQLAAGLVSERLAITQAATEASGSEAPAAPTPVLVEPVFLETVLVDGERDRALLTEAVLGSPADEVADERHDRPDGDRDGPAGDAEGGWGDRDDRGDRAFRSAGDTELRYEPTATAYALP